MTDLQIQGLADWLERHDYAATSGVPAFPTQKVCPVQDLYFQHRLRRARPIPLGVHSHPSRFWQRLSKPALALYETLYLHRPWRGVGEGPNDWLTCDGLSPWQVTALALPQGQRTFLSSIQGRSAGEFTYLGDDSGLLIEASWEWLQGRDRDGRSTSVAAADAWVRACPRGLKKSSG